MRDWTSAETNGNELEVTGMSQREDADRRLNDAREARSGARKPYTKPAVRYERVFETNALTCGKVQTSQQGCHQNRKTS